MLLERRMSHHTSVKFSWHAKPQQRRNGTGLPLEAQGHVVAYPTMLKPAAITNRYDTYDKVPFHLTSASRVGMYYALKPT